MAKKLTSCEYILKKFTTSHFSFSENSIIIMVKKNFSLISIEKESYESKKIWAESQDLPD